MKFLNPLDWILSPFRMVGCCLGMLAVLLCGSLTCATAGTIVVANAFHLGFSSGGGANMIADGFTIGGDNSVTLAAKEIAAHLHNCRGMHVTNPVVQSYIDENGCNNGKSYPIYAAYDAGFSQDILRHYSPWPQFWASGTLQCVSFVLASYYHWHMLPTSSNAKYLLATFAGWPDYQTIPAQPPTDPNTAPAVKQLPITPGDIFVMRGASANSAGHTGIVLGWKAPSGGKPGEMTIAEGNAWKPIETLPINPDNSINLNNNYWNGYAIIGYIHPTKLPIVPPYQTSLTQNQYINVARQAAQDNGIRSDIYIKLIETESHFDPNAVSPVGAIGIAQLMATTASDLGVNPHDPIASLKGGAKYLKQLLDHYNGDYQKAVAAYNAGPGTVDDAINHHHDDWLSALAQETQNYVRKVLGN